MMKEQFENSYLFGGNAPFVEELYEAWLENAADVPESWQRYFEDLARQPGAAPRDVAHAPVVAAFEAAGRNGFRPTASGSGGDVQKSLAVENLINAYRFNGHERAELDPLKRDLRPPVADLDPKTYGLTDADMSRSFDTGDFKVGSGQTAPLNQIIDALKQTYCHHIGVEYMYMTSTAEKKWIQARIEPNRGQAAYSAEEKKRFLERLTAAETLERYLHTRYVGQKRFSLEGGESLILSMDELIRVSGGMGAKEIVIGMAHRGRLNVLVNTLGKKPAMLFDEFEGKKKIDLGSGDVKYHMGYSSDVSTPGGPVHLTLAFNPSHLEIVNPVVEGSVFARQFRVGVDGKKEIIPVLIHGDAAVIGQGCNQEMLNFAQTRGYGTGGTIHIVVNNQIGFTTSDPRDYRSGYYCTDIFKMSDSPIFHVNGDDAEAVALVTRLAVEYRQTFKKDVVIDIFCFRKLGHNEQDEPMVTQPLMYKKVQAHPGTRKLYADQLVASGVVPADGPDNIIKDFRAHLDKGELLVNPVISDYKRKNAQDWRPFMTKQYIETANTKVPAKELKRLGLKLAEVPEGFVPHSRVKKILEDRKAMAEGKLPVDWGMGENLAYATLLAEGYGVRISGEDVGRGTFFHRHATIHDQNRESWDAGSYQPLAHLQTGQGSFQCYESVLSEESVLAFEYGYATAEPNQLVIWEAQFGDFVNGAQVVVDQFIASGETKWNRGCGLVMLLPHGYEGQGPEHSSARPERFIQLCAEMNMEVCVPSSASQIYHVLRRQMVRKQRKPLVIFSPKSLLRNKDASCALDDLAKGEFQRVIGEVDDLNPAKVTRVILCSGKVYYELLNARREQKLDHIAIVRIEQLYPFPEESFKAELAKFPKATEIVWCQEEPRNQGFWYWFASRQHLARSVGPKQSLLLVSRPAAASPAVGYLAKHNEQHKTLIESAMGKIEY